MAFCRYQLKDARPQVLGATGSHMAAELTTNKASANPTKTFFVKMITRDILLEDCILDLIDNSVDGAWRSEGSHPMGLAQDADLSKYTISLSLSPDTFTIIDNCGGMTLDDAVNHAFSFGRRVTEEHDEYSIGVYGIGMKRAIFKLGSDIRIRSTSTDDKNERLAFVVPINVATWVTDDAPPWDFDIETDEPLQQDGVEITVKTLWLRRNPVLRERNLHAEPAADDRSGLHVAP